MLNENLKNEIANKMTSTDDKKLTEERKYAQFSRQSIKLMGEQSGHSGISDMVATILAEDSNYRIREIINNAMQIMKHQRRKKLYTQDIQNSLKWSDIEPIYGFGNPDPINMVYVREAEVYCHENEEINLLDYISVPLKVDLPTPPYIQVEWVAVEGIPKAPLPSSATLLDFKLLPKKTPISSELMDYYTQITRAILENDEELQKFALVDLQTNDRITPLLPYFINFVATGLHKLSHDLIQMNKLLRMINSLVTNKALYLGCHPYLTLIVQSVLYCILEPLAACINPINDHWALRDSAALLLAHILKEWSTPHDDLREHTVTTLRESFTDLGKPFCYHYGAIVGLMAIGLEEAEATLRPHLPHYWPHLMEALNDLSFSHVQIKLDAHRVHGILLLACFRILRQHIDSLCEPHTMEPPKKNCTKELLAMYKEFYEYFGDALALRLPPIQCTDIFLTLPKPPPIVELFTGPEMVQTGEEMLETFYEKDEEMKSALGSMDEENSYDDNSIFSDDHDNDKMVALQIKSTISDPALGIKLTIAKLRKDKPPSPPPPPVKKLGIRSSEPGVSEPVFVPIPFKLPTNYIEFNFEGSMPLPQHLLKQRRPSLGPCPPSSQFHWLSCKMKKKGKLKHKPSPKTMYLRKFFTGNLYSIL